MLSGSWTVVVTVRGQQTHSVASCSLAKAGFTTSQDAVADVTAFVPPSCPQHGARSAERLAAHVHWPAHVLVPCNTLTSATLYCQWILSCRRAHPTVSSVVFVSRFFGTVICQRVRVVCEDGCLTVCARLLSARFPVREIIISILREAGRRNTCQAVCRPQDARVRSTLVLPNDLLALALGACLVHTP